MRTFGFTAQERRIVIFLLIMIALGSLVQLYKSRRDFFLESPEEAQKRNQAIHEFLIIAHDSTQTLPFSKNYNLENIQDSSILVININTASELELQKLPYIGPVLAKRIVDFRKQFGEFKSIEEIIKVKGVGEKTYNNISMYLKIK